MNKKGIMGMALVNIYSIFLLILIVAAFYFLIGNSVKQVKEEVIEAEEINEESLFLLNYLRTSVGDKNIADLIAEGVKDNDFSKLETETEKIFDKMEDCFVVKVNGREIGKCEGTQEMKVETIIPGFEDDIKIELSMVEKLEKKSIMERLFK